MRISLTSLLFFFATCLFGQVTTFSALEPATGQMKQFTLTENASRPAVLTSVFTKYDVFEAPLDAIHQFATSQKGAFKVVLAFGEKQTVSLELNRVSLWNGTASMHIASETGVAEYPMPVPTTYRGSLSDNPSAMVACSFADGFSSGMIVEGNSTFYWEPLFRYVPDAPHNWIIRYEAADVIPVDGIFCPVKDEDMLQEKITDIQPGGESVATGCYEIELAQAADWSMWQKYGGATGVVNYMASVMNQVQMNYDNEFSNEISFRIVGAWLSSCSSCDPWTSSTSSDALLSDFRDWGNGLNGFPGLTFDLAQLWTDRDFDGAVVGLAYVGTACTGSGYHEIQDWTTGDLLRVTVAHEIGHNLSASHDAAGSPTIMAPAANNSSTWSAQSTGQMNPYIQGRIDLGCLFPCSSFHVEYGKVGEEGFSNREGLEIIEKTTFYDCEPVWTYFSFNQIEGGTTVEGKTEWILPGGTINTNTFSQGPAPAGGWEWLRYSQYYNSLPAGTHQWKLYQRIPSGDYVLVTSKFINVIYASNQPNCGEKLHLPMNGNTQDVSGQNNHAVVQGVVFYGTDRFGNCNGSVRITNGNYLKAPVINERAVSLWFKMNVQDQMVIYDSGPNGEESKDFNIGVYKPNGLWGNASFDNTYGVFFSTWDRDIAIPFDAIKTGWHHVVVSRVDEGYERFRVMIDGQVPAGYFWNGDPAVSAWSAQTQPFTFPADGSGIPNLFVPNYKTYMGRDSMQDTEFFDGWIDEVRVFNQLLNINEMTQLFNAPNDNPNNVNATVGQPFYCSGQTIQLIASANNATSFSWSGPGNYSSSQQNPTIPNSTTAMSGNYILTVNVTGGCIIKDTINVIVNTTPVVSSVGIDECAGLHNGSITANASGGTGLMYNWSNGQISSTISGLTGGATYTVTVTNSGGCSASTATAIGVIPTPSVTVSNTVGACLGQTNGSISVSVSGGTTPYQYLWSNGQTTANISNLTSGTYTVTVTGSNGCAVTTTATVAVASTPSAGIASTTTTCANATTGSASVAAGGGIPPYQYLWSNGQTGFSIFNLAVGNYTVTVTGTNGCAVTAVATIEPLPTPVPTISATTETCTGESDGTATVSVSGGISPYFYVWTSGANQPTATNLPVGTYTVTVYGSNGCSAAATATISMAPTPVPTISSFSNSCSGQSNGFATATVTGGAPPLQYLWTNGQTTATASNLAAGTYTVTVTGSNGCTGSATAFIGTSSAPTPSASAISTCSGLTNGSATVTVVGGVPPYQYAWSNGQTTATATNLAAGTYTVTVTSNGGCSASTTATVGTSSTPTAVVSLTTGTCQGQSNGSATVTASGGTQPYQYLWSNGQTTATVTNLAVGTFTVTVTGNNGCSTTTTATINALSAPAATISATTSPCPGQSTGSATVTASGGATPYQYHWSNGQTAATASNLVAGTYTVTVTGNNGCTGTATATVAAASAPTASISSTTGPCTGLSNGSATVTATGGATPYSYAWSNGQTSATASNLAAGSYTVTVTGSNGCSATATANVVTASTPVANISSTMGACSGSSNGFATVTANGGALPYQYLWSNGQTTATAANLSAGTYTVTVTGNNGCTATATATITTANAPVTNISASSNSCAGSATGSATVTANGGITPYQYLWSNGQTTATATNLATGIYTVTVTGNNGCSATATATIGTAPTPTVVNTNTIGACPGQTNGTATVTLSGGITPYQYLWSNGQTTATAVNLAVGTYTVTVTGGNGCSVTATATVSANGAPAVVVSGTTDVCFGQNTGSATIAVSGGSLPYQYLWSNGQTAPNATNLAAGNYTVTVTGSNGCTGTATCTILSVQMNVQFGNITDLPTGLCQATVTIAGGVPPYSYAWSNGETTNPALGLPNGPFTVTITDALGCTSVSADMCTAVGSSDINEINDIRIYPNPSTGIVQFSASLPRFAEVEIRVVDVLGRLVYRVNAFGDTILEEIDLSQSPAGLYFVEARIGKDVRVAKLVVSRD